MKLTKEQKDGIRADLQIYISRYPSQNKAAASLDGVSVGTVSTILSGVYDKVSDDMFAKVRAQISSRKRADWVLCETRVYRELTTVLEDAQEYSDVAWVVSHAGSGKDATTYDYASRHENTFIIECSEDMRRSDFIHGIARAVGIGTSDMSLRVTLDKVAKYLLTLENPVLVFNEGDKLSDSLLYYFITIYNRLEGHCGIIFLSTSYIKRRMEIGLSYNKKGYDEIHSRICRRFVELTPVSEYEVAAITRANGIADDKTVNAIVKDAASGGYDLRRVRRLIDRQRRIAAIRS